MNMPRCIADVPKQLVATDANTHTPLVRFVLKATTNRTDGVSVYKLSGAVKAEANGPTLRACGRQVARQPT